MGVPVCAALSAKGRAAHAKAVRALFVAEACQGIGGYGFAHNHAGVAAPLSEQGVGQKHFAKVFAQGGGSDKQRVVAHRHVQGNKIKAGYVRLAAAKPAEQARPRLLGYAAPKLPAGHTPCGEDSKSPALAQVVHGTAQHRSIGRSTARKIKGQQHGGQLGQLRDAQQGRAGKNFEVWPRPATQGGHHQAFQRAGGVVGKKNDRPLGGDAPKVAAQAVRVYIERGEAGHGKGLGVTALGKRKGHFFQPGKTRKLAGRSAGQPPNTSDQRAARRKG